MKDPRQRNEFSDFSDDPRNTGYGTTNPNPYDNYPDERDEEPEDMDEENDDDENFDNQ